MPPLSSSFDNFEEAILIEIDLTTDKTVSMGQPIIDGKSVLDRA